jgi:hypothetical protein
MVGQNKHQGISSRGEWLSVSEGGLCHVELIRLLVHGGPDVLWDGCQIIQVRLAGSGTKILEDLSKFRRPRFIVIVGKVR